MSLPPRAAIDHYENFPVASWLCPPRLRAPIAAIYHFARTAFQVLSKEQEFAQWAPDDQEQLITLTAPRDLQERLRQLPREVIDANDRYILCANKDRVADAIEKYILAAS